MAVSGYDPSRVMAAAQAAVQGHPEVAARRPAEARGDGAPAPAADVKRAADDFNRAFESLDVEARFSVHEATGQIIVDVVDTRTGDVIREIPPRELLDRWVQMMDLMGLLVDDHA
jgi:flagellar protein FlaG